MRALRIHRRDRQGLTLIELLVTVMILLMITAIAIPIVAPSGDERRTRESSRLVTSYLQGARTRAIQTGRPFGVMIEAVQGIPETAVQLSYAEVQAPWAGDFADTRAHIIAQTLTGDTFIRGGIGFFVDSTGAVQGNSGWIGLLRPGDIVKLGYQGAYYAIQPGEPFKDGNGNGSWDSGEEYVDLNLNGSYQSAFDCTDTSTGYIKSLPWTLAPLTAPLTYTTWIDLNSNGTYQVGEGNGVPFQIYRQPVKTAGAPLTLPEGMVVDLSGSGWGTTIFGPEPFVDANNNKTRDGGETFTDVNGSGSWDVGSRGPFIILFSPGGGLASVTLRQPPPSGFVNGAPGSLVTNTPTGTLHLLLGKVENTPATPGLENWRDLSSIWVSIHPQTGLVTGTEVGGDLNNDGVITLAESLYFAVRGQSMGGR
jgi:prepilin-type N-terminal cleavage/methylation domain-containing protein